MHTRLWPLLLFCACAFAVSSLGAPAEQARGHVVLEPFDYHGVELEGGRLGAQYDQVRADYLAISNDGLLKGFRQRAGLPAPGPELGGDYTSGTFQIFGQIISGLSRFYAGSGDEACRDKANLLVHEWSRCIAPDGFFFYTPRGSTLHYVYDKMVGGLVDNYLYCHNEEALTALERITEWAIRALSRNHHGWNAEWYTLSENLFRAYRATGDRKYLEFAEVWEYPDYWNLYAENQDIFSKPPVQESGPITYHAYSHINTLSGAAAAYEVTGTEHYLRTLVHAHDYLETTQMFTTGGYGPGEMLLPRAELTANLASPYQTKHFETQCGSWAVFKLSKYLLRFTGEARYGDWIERLVYNGIGASLPMRPQGCVMYESDYRLSGGVKRNTRQPWSCCAGTRSMAIADYADLIYFHDADNLYVNLFTPSRVEWMRGTDKITVRQQTLFPESDATQLVFQLERPNSFGVRIRLPWWLAGKPVVTVNDRPAKADSLDSGWLSILREWKDGDRLALTLPMALRASPFESDKPFPAAILHGPVVLAVGSDGPNPGYKMDRNDPAASLVPLPGKPLHFSLASDPTLTARPFYEFIEKEPYFLYFDPAWATRRTFGSFSPK